MSVQIWAPAVHSRTYAACGIPSSPHRGTRVGGLCIFDGRRPEVRIEVDVAGALQPNGDGVYTRSLHQLGSPLVDLRTFRLPADAKSTQPPVVYGPGTDRPFLPMARFKGLGVPIQRDDPQIVANYSRAATIGHLWIRPGFPAVARFQDWRVSDGRVRGVLASSVDRPGGFVVLEAVHLAHVMGYPPDALPSVFGERDLDGLVPLECLQRLLDWAEIVLPQGRPNVSEEVATGLRS